MKALVLAAAIAAAFPAVAQFEVGTGTKPVATSPDTVMPAGKIFIDTTTIQPRQPAFTTERIGIACVGTIDVAPCNTATTVPARNASTENWGSFRVICRYSHASFDDPIVWPGEAGRTHLHLFFGNDSTRSTSDVANMATVGGSTCTGGTLNRSGYWVPALVYHCEDAGDIAGTNPGLSSGCSPARNGEVMRVIEANFYYKINAGNVGSDTPGYGSQPMQWPPAGFRMISGCPNANNCTAPPNSAQTRVFYCVRNGTADIFSENYIPTTADAVAAGGCSTGAGEQEIKFLIAFPECWNGTDLDDPATHQAHVAERDFYEGCNTNVTEYDGTVVSGSNYPVAFVQVAPNIHYALPDIADFDFVRLSSDLPRAEARVHVSGDCLAANNWCAGRTSHADWINGWKSTTMNPSAGGGSWGMSITDALLQECYMVGSGSAISSDCHNHLLGSPLGDGNWWTLQ